MPQSGLNQEVLLRRITNRIRQSLELPEILTATVAEVRSLLGTDRIMIYRFQESGGGEVIAESIQEDCLPSMKGLCFPADDIPEKARQLYLQVRMRSIVDVASGKIGLSPIDYSADDFSASKSGEIYYRSVDSCHGDYLEAMGVQSSIVLPILYHDIRARKRKKRLWGLLVSHHAQPRSVAREELQVLQGVVDQLSIAIAQSTLLSQARQQHYKEATINRVSTLLHSLPTTCLQAALEETVTALGGSGGRLYIAPNHRNSAGKLFGCGSQPSHLSSMEGNLIEEHPNWQAWIASSIEKNGNSPLDPCQPLTITDLYKTPILGVLTSAFRLTAIRGILLLPLNYRSSLRGYISVFRDQIETEILWAGRFDTSKKQKYPRQSFEAWRELKRGQAQAWTSNDLEVAIALSSHFAMAIEQYQLYSQVNSLNSNLEQQVKERTAKLRKSLNRERAIQCVTNHIRSTLDLKTTLQSIVQEVRNLIDTDRVAIYQFLAASQGEVIVESKKSNCSSILGVVTPTGYFRELQLKLYQRGRVQVIRDVVQTKLTPIHQDLLQSLQIRAALVVPIGRSTHHQNSPIPKDQKRNIEQPPWGLLIAQDCNAPRDWLPDEIDLLKQLADQAAVAIQQAELYEQSRNAAATATDKAQKLMIAAQQQQALFRVITKIRESLDVKTIFKATTTEVRRLLNADRVAVFRIILNSGNEEGKFISEDVKPGFAELMDATMHDYCFGRQYSEKYRLGKIQAIADIYNAGMNNCYVQMLAKFQVRANLVVPILKGDTLWGLLCIHQCAEPRQWQTSNIEFVSQIAAHLGVAIKQAELLTQTQQQTEHLKRTQAQLIQTEKMSSLGQLVAGVAHEINNPVNFIYGNLSHTSEYINNLLSLLHLYQHYYPYPQQEIAELAKAIDLDFLEQDLAKILKSMEIGSERIRSLVMSLGNFSRLSQAEVKPVDIHEGLESTLLILQHRLKPKRNHSGIKIVKNFAELPLVECFAGQLNQVFMNILSNAIDALEDYQTTLPSDKRAKFQPQITICTNLKPKGNLLGEEKREYPNPRVLISIADNGSGISKELQSKIFDPFFTTKPPGKGTGIGLSISYQIVVEQHKGSFKCISQVGEGTEFLIEIPEKSPLNISL